MSGLTLTQTAPHTWAVADENGHVCTVRRDGDGLWWIVEPSTDEPGHAFEKFGRAVAEAGVGHPTPGPRREGGRL